MYIKQFLAQAEVPTANDITVAQVDIQSLIDNIVGAVFGLAVLVLFALIVYGGYTYLTSAGESEKIKKAQNILTNSVIGFGIIAGAFVIIKLIARALGISIDNIIG